MSYLSVLLHCVQKLFQYHLHNGKRANVSLHELQFDYTKKRLLQTITTLRNHMDSDTILQIEWINTKSIVNKTYKLAAEPSTKKNTL